MIEPVQLADFFTVFFSAAMVIVAGAVYALLFAFARLKKLPRLMPFAYLAYAGLAASAVTLARAANLLNHPLWAGIVGLMLLGYLVAPHAIWHLCVGTHADELEAADPESAQFSQPSR
ncbi:MAG TPA: hypothetical protein VF811_11405 [Parasulfuritortus sp.]